ncbi:MAG: hypothetical protein KBD78_03675 [Oligoflexales bacterium]|nr:hypothetical protein [Oligoflexales bacterium]
MLLSVIKSIKIRAVCIVLGMHMPLVYARPDSGAKDDGQGFETNSQQNVGASGRSTLDAEIFYMGLDIEPTVFIGPVEKISIKDIGFVVAKMIEDPQRPHPIFEIFFNKDCQNTYSLDSASVCFNTWMDFVFSGSSLILQNVEVLTAFDQINDLKKLQQRLKLTQRANEELQWLQDGGKNAFLAIRLEFDPQRNQIVISYYSLHFGSFQSPRLIVEVLLDAGNKPSKAFIRDLSLQNKKLMETLFKLFEMDD